MIDIHERAINRIGDILIELQDRTLYRMSDALEAAEARADSLAAQLATAQAALEQVTQERDALKIEHSDGCDWKRRYDRQGYPIYDATCGASSEPGEVEFSGFNFCPYCGKSITVVLESRP